MFRRKKDDTVELKNAADPAPIAADGETDDDAPPLKNYAAKRAGHPIMPPAAMRNDIPRRGMVDLPGSGPRRYDRPSDATEGKKLIVGRDIELAGEISACDRLVVEGKVTADLTDAGGIEVAQTGVFRGSAEVDEADISGLFDGNLTVRRRLTIRATGRVRGTVRYARIAIELGGEIHGTAEVLQAGNTPDDDTVRRLTAPARDEAFVADPTA